MKYKKQIATGALAISLLVGGSNVFASTPQDLGIKNIQSIYQKQNKDNKNQKAKSNLKNNVVGTVGAINGSGFTVEVKNKKTKITSSTDISTNALTKYSKNGVKVTLSDLAGGQKVIVVGTLDKTTNILTAKTVKIVK
ncbi:MAG: hypothetical protein NTZ87_03355 [Candidatus Nomurabacteria bacterium]|nr:hypothetical protein [Candidatus Nomurabacteria bacterium]